MIDRTAPQVVRNYLNQLEVELVGVAADVRDGIVAGVAEELSGLDAAAAAARIETLGDPAFIAAEARAEGPAPVVSAPAPDFGMSSQRWYIVLTTVLIEFGGIVIPLAGWVVGIMLLWASPLWTRVEKLAATFAPVSAGLVVSVIAGFVFQERAVTLSEDAETIDPLIPGFAWHAAIFAAIAAAVIASIIIGIVLSRRAWGRTVPERVDGR